MLGRMHAPGFDLREEAVLRILTQDVLKTSAIEGERPDAEQVRPSLAGSVSTPARSGLSTATLRASSR